MPIEFAVREGLPDWAPWPSCIRRRQSKGCQDRRFRHAAWRRRAQREKTRNRRRPRAAGSIHSDGRPAPGRRPGERRSSFTLGIGEKLAGFGLEDDDERAEGHVVAIFSTLFGSEQSLIAAPGQVIHTGLQFGICFQGQEPPGRLRGQAFAKGANKPVESWSSIRRFHAEIIPLRWQGAKGTCGTETATYSAHRLSSCNHLGRRDSQEEGVDGLAPGLGDKVASPTH